MATTFKFTVLGFKAWGKHSHYACACEEGIHRAGLHLRPVCADRAWPPLQGTLSSVLGACGNDKGRTRPRSGQGNLEEEKTDTNHPCLRTVSITVSIEM